MKRKYVSIFAIALLTVIGIKCLETEGQHEPKQEISIMVDTNSEAEFSISDTDEEKIVYCDTKEEAIANSDPKMLSDYAYARQVDTAIASIESEDEAIFFYLSYETKRRGCYVIAKFYKKEVDGKTQYGLVSVIHSEAGKLTIGYEKNPEENVRFSLKSSDVERMLGYRFTNSNERTVWGVSKLEEVNHLLLDGQRPDEVIQYKRFDEDWYFWYYRDLKSDVDVSEINIEFDE